MTIVLILIALLAAVLLVMHLWTRHLTNEGFKTVPQLGQIVPVTGGSIHYVEKGNPEAQTIVMIHGLAGQLQHFTYALVDALADEYHVIALDRPGCGYSTREAPEVGRLPEQARMINEFLEVKGISDAVLVGHSLGGALSLAIALDYPNRVAALALLAPLTHKMPAPPVIFKSLEIRSEWIRNLVGKTLAVPIAAKTAPHSLYFAFDPEPVPDDFLSARAGHWGYDRQPSSPPRRILSAWMTASQPKAPATPNCEPGRRVLRCTGHDPVTGAARTSDDGVWLVLRRG